MFARTISSLGRAVGWPKRVAARSTTDELDRRVWIRYPCDVEAACKPADSAECQRLSSRVRNVSRGGINLIMDCSVAVGAFLSVELPAPDGEPPATVLAYVARVTPWRDGQWSVGCTFASELSDGDLEPFGAQRLKPNTDDQRSWVRFPCKSQATYQLVKDPQSNPRSATVVNISASGVGLQVNHPNDLGTLLNLELRDAQNQFTLKMLACVVRINPRRRSEWIMGCNLIRELSNRELKALLAGTE